MRRETRFARLTRPTGSQGSPQLFGSAVRVASGLLVLASLLVWPAPSGALASSQAQPVLRPAGDDVGGDITTDTTWTLAGSPWVIRTNVTVFDGVTLTIEPGVTVYVVASTSLRVYGTLLAEGTEALPITFGRQTPESAWGMVQVGGGTVAGDSNGSRISYATFDGGGAASLGHMLYFLGTGATLDHLTVRNSASVGLQGQGLPTGATLSISNSSFTGNASHGLQPNEGRYVLSALTVAANLGDGLHLNGADDFELLGSQVQNNTGDGIHSDSGVRLTLDGLTISGNGGYGIDMNTSGAGSIVRDTQVHNNGVAAKLHPDTLLSNVTWSGSTRSEIEWISGEIAGNRTWARLPEINTYRILGNVTAQDGTTLTIEPGVTVYVAANTSLRVYGTLLAEGTEALPITFGRQTPGSAWGMVQVGGGAVAGDSNGSRISYATFDGGGTASLGHMLYFLGTGATLQHLTARNSATVGIQINATRGQLFTIETAIAENNVGTAILQAPADLSVAYHHLTLHGNGTDALVITGGAIGIGVQWDLAEAGAPVRTGGLSVYGGSFLALAPGSRLELSADASLSVAANGKLFALGTPAQPITLTATSVEPADAWRGVHVQSGGRAFLDNCDLGYGGASGTPLLKLDSKDAVVSNCRIHDSAANGVQVQPPALPVLQNNQILNNVAGACNGACSNPVTIAALNLRKTWWGAASGPYHPTLNPGGQGNPVGDNIQFEPWLTEPPAPGPRPPGLSMLVTGPAAQRQAAGSATRSCSATAPTRTLSSTVVVADLPRDGEYRGWSPGARYWPKRRQVFWMVKPLAPGETQTFYLPVRYDLNIATGTWEKTLGDMTGIAGVPSVFTAADYANYSGQQLTGTQALTKAQLAAVLAASPGLNQLYQETLGQGYLYGRAYRLSYAAADPLLRIILLDFPNRRTMILQQQGTRLLATVAAPDAVILSNTGGGTVTTWPPASTTSSAVGRPGGPAQRRLRYRPEIRPSATA